MMRRIISICLIIICSLGLCDCAGVDELAETSAFSEATVPMTLAEEMPEEAAIKDGTPEKISSSEEFMKQIETQREAVLSFFSEHPEEMEEIAQSFCKAQKEGIGLWYRALTKELGQRELLDDRVICEYEPVIDTEWNRLLDQCNISKVFLSVQTPPGYNLQIGCCFRSLPMDGFDGIFATLELVYFEEAPTGFDENPDNYEFEQVAPNWYLIVHIFKG